jgi:hypothetical protein
VDGLRVPARFWLMTVLCLSVAGGLFAATVLRGHTRLRRAAVLALLAVAIMADGWAAPVPAQPPPAAAPDPAALRGGVVLELPVEPYPDIGATWRAVTGGWRSVNGYSGYAPNYYATLQTASRIADASALDPFRRGHDLHVLVADDATSAREMVERQPGVVPVARGNGLRQYRLPALGPAPAPVRRERLPIDNVMTTCVPADVRLAFDGDDRTLWECVYGPASGPLVISRPHRHGWRACLQPGDV